MAWNTMITEQTLTVGERTFGPYVIPADVSSVHVRNTRINWPDTGSEVMKATVDLSLDQGKTWLNGYGGWSALGGPVEAATRPDEVSNTTVVRIHFPITGDNKRRIRINLVVYYEITSLFEFEIY